MVTFPELTRVPGAPAYLHTTIPEIVESALDPRVDEVTLDWPADQAWPDSASLDPIRNGADDEIGYVIADVEISG